MACNKLHPRQDDLKKPLIVLLDANVLYSACLRDFLLRLAAEGLYRPLWIPEIQDEWGRKLLPQHPKLEKTQQEMDKYCPCAIVKGYKHLIPQVQLPDPSDRHVLAAAIHGGATVIVTENLSDFPDHRLAPYGLIAQSPDTFIADKLIKADRDRVLSATTKR